MVYDALIQSKLFRSQLGDGSVGIVRMLPCRERFDFMLVVEEVAFHFP